MDKRKKILKELYNLIRQDDIHKTLESLFLIIQIKGENRSLIHYRQSIYLDIKRFIKVYIEVTEVKDYGYDKLDLKKIREAIGRNSNANERLQLSKYAYRQLFLTGRELELGEFKGFTNKCKTEALSKDQSFVGKWNLMAHLLSYNVYSIILMLISLFMVSYVIFLPAASETLEIFRLNYESYAENFYLNHFVNLLSLAFYINDGDLIVPQNWLGVIILAILKSIYVLVILNYLYQKLLTIIYAS